jgi:Fibronectin type III domain
MKKARSDWAQIRQLWPVVVAVLAACGGAGQDEAASSDDEAGAVSSERATAEGRRRSSWITCATEGGVCTVPTGRQVRYGANGTYFSKWVTASIPCTNAAWGDPLVGVTKRCEYSSSTSTAAPRAPAPAPAPAPTPAPTPAPAPSPAPAPAPAPVYTGAASLSWNAPASTTVSGYRVYYGTAPGTYQQALGTGAWAGNATSYNVTGLAKGATYYFAVTSVDSRGNESTFSSEGSKLVQ